MMPNRAPRYLLDVNVAVALLNEEHAHHDVAKSWFNMPNLQWAMCGFTEAGVLRFFARPQTGSLELNEASALLEDLRSRPGYHYLPITSDWPKLTRSFVRRLHGHGQITDAFLLGLAIHEGLVLATFDKALLHLAGEHRVHVHVLTTPKLV